MDDIHVPSTAHECGNGVKGASHRACKSVEGGRGLVAKVV